MKGCDGSSGNLLRYLDQEADVASGFFSHTLRPGSLIDLRPFSVGIDGDFISEVSAAELLSGLLAVLPAARKRCGLYLNDKLIGELPTSPEQQCKALFTVPYAPGTLKAAGVNDDRERLRRSTVHPQRPRHSSRSRKRRRHKQRTVSGRSPGTLQRPRAGRCTKRQNARCHSTFSQCPSHVDCRNID
jgi:Domain of unknown function (DUF4982)